MNNLSYASSTQHNDDLLLLAAGHAMGDLSDDEMRSLSTSTSALASPDVQQLLNEFDLCATTALLTMMDRMPNDEMPASLKQSILKTGANYFSGIAPATTSRPSISSASQPSVDRTSRISTSVRFREAVAWLSLAASLLLIAGLTVPKLFQRSIDRVAVSNSERRQTLIDSATDLTRATWSAGKSKLKDAEGNPVDITGDIVWSSASQQGYMRFRGLPINDATKEQYQLWIVDPSRDDEPVDGGVFDSTGEAEIVIPIQAKLAVSTPTLFAITVEKPGGVVVSTQERLPLVATVNPGSGPQ